MKLFPLLFLLALSLVREGTSTHLETCECHEIRELVNASVQQAVARLEDSFGIMIDTAISNINTTDKTALFNLESRLTSTIQGLFKPIQSQLDYHLPPPPPTTSAPLPTTSAPPLTTSAPLPTTSAPLPTTIAPPPTTSAPPPTTSAPPPTTSAPPPTTSAPPPTTSAPPPTTSALLPTTSIPPPLGETADDPATSCKDLYDTLDASSGYYWIGEIGSAVRVYCNMSLTCGNLTGGWMRVANIDMTNTSQNCPSGLTLASSPKRVCDINTYGCVSNDFDIHGVQYSHICGRVIGYTKYVNYAFEFRSRGIDADYVSGVSLTHGLSPRQHIWTFAGALDETSNGAESRYKCPCVNPNLDPTPIIPSFIGNDYFCDTAFETRWNTIPNINSIHVSDPLWDGEGCGPTNTCCYDPQREANPPWFVKTLSSPTSDDIEMRLCAPNGGLYTTPIEIVELYVQ